jgi:MFS family permease
MALSRSVTEISIGSHVTHRSYSAADGPSRNASLTLGLTQPTDTVLYLLLPLFPEAFGVTLAEAGILLAANRIVRIVGYGCVAAAYQRHGPRIVCMAAVIGAVASSLGYAWLPANLWWLLPARLAWGLSFAAMNIAVQALPTAEHQGMARRSGRSRAIVAAGTTAGLIAGAALSHLTGARGVFIVLAAVALAATPFAMRLPSGRGEAVHGGPRFALPSRLDTWAFVQGMTLDGVFTFGLAVLARAALPQNADIAAAAALAMRFVAEIVLGPPSGLLADRVGAMRLLVSLSCASAIGLAAIGFGSLWPAAIAVTMLRGLIQPLPAPVTAALYPGTQRVPALARLATWRDLGAGVGPLIAGLLLPAIPPHVLYAGTAMLLAISAVAMLGADKKMTSPQAVP